MYNRRYFLKSAVAGGLGFLHSSCLFIPRRKPFPPIKYFGVHQFIENHPEAVFIMLTDVETKTDSDAKRKAGLSFGRSVFVPKEKGEGCIPLTHRIAIKPNLTCSLSDEFSLEYGMGIVTDPYFVEGTIEAMKELGFSGSQFYIREVNCPECFGPRGYLAVAERTGADMRDQHADVGKISENELHWTEVPNGCVHKKIPHLWPINSRDTWFLNIAKFKAHGMGLTLCCKNHQGSIASPYQRLCGDFPALKGLNQETLVEDYEEKCNAGYKLHLSQGIPRWDRPEGGGEGGLRMDIWATRTLDNIASTPTGLSIIEGIYGRDGNGFHYGPNPEGNDNNYKGEAWDYMTNIIIFGKNPVYVDIIGHWLGGHEPGNFGLFHLALERGMSDTLNPAEIPVYLWKDSKAALTPLADFKRTPLKTYYLQRDYNGQNEPKYHMVDEPFNYTPVKTQKTHLQIYPGLKVLRHSQPNPFNPGLPIEYAVPQDSYARIEILDSSFRTLDVLVDDYHRKGHHMTVWNDCIHLPGAYYCRLRLGDFDKSQKIVLLQ
jgi:hypothetical protein